ncbi:hypothetical protein K438DRAFT_1992878 [Mycena galopus ATCC 62051]|nr:hypothetical protein K438DRAFT_1992878 [Mycena galopus ATCC 62051]
MYPDPDNEGFHIETDPSDEMYPDPDNNEEFHTESGLQQSDTIWQDPGITSLVLVGKFRISTKVTVQRIEFVMPHGVIPSIWPNPRIPTAFVLNLGSSYDEIDPKTGKMYTVDFLIKNHDNDSWKSDGSGTGSDKPNIRFDPGQPPIECGCPRMGCKVCYACERIDRYELDPASRDAIFSAQQETRRREGTTAEDVTAGFLDIVDKKRCPAVDSAGKPYQGRPKLMPKKKLIAGTTSGSLAMWRKDFKENHRTYSIPDYVNEKMLIKLFAGEPIADGTLKDTPPCTDSSRSHALAQEKELREQLKTAKASASSSSTRRRRNTNASRSVIVSASSIGRVKTVPAIPAVTSTSALPSIDNQTVPTIPALASTSALPNIDALNNSLPHRTDIAPPPVPPLDGQEFDALSGPSVADPAFTALHGPNTAGLYETLPYVPNYIGTGDLNASSAAETCTHMVPYPDMSMFSASDPTTLYELLSFNSSLLGTNIDGGSIPLNMHSTTDNTLYFVLSTVQAT